MKTTVTKKFTFESAHHLPDYDGPCHNVHGHSYKLEVTLSGPIQKRGTDKGMIMDFTDLKSIVKDTVIDVLDHVDLNKVIGLKVPTAENIANWIYETLVGSFDLILNPETQIVLERVRLFETETSYVEVTRE